MTTDINALGLACPQPVLKTKQAVDQIHPLHLTVRVDNEAAVENVSRFLNTRGYETTASVQGGDFTITASQNAGHGQGTKKSMEAQSAAALVEDDTPEPCQKILVFIATDRMGFGDDDLGRKLMISFVKTLGEMGDDLWRLVFVNNGVKLTITGSPVLETLQEYEQQGISILVCGTCLAHFDLLKAKQVGDTTNMLDIVTSLQLARKVIHP
jgi:selenium metabolism protein YedF